MIEVDRLTSTDDDRRCVEKSRYPRNRSVGLVANKNGIDVNLNADRSAKYMKSVICLFVCLLGGLNDTFDMNRLYRAITAGHYIT